MGMHRGWFCLAYKNILKINGQKTETSQQGKDLDPAIFFIHLQDVSKKQSPFKNFFWILYFARIFATFSKKKCQKKSQISSNQCFSSPFCMIIAGAGSGSIPLTNGSGSGSRRPKNMCNRWIQIRIRNHNTVCNILCKIHPIQIRIRIKKKSDPDWHQKIIHLQYNTSMTGIRTTLESFPIISNLKDIMIADCIFPLLFKIMTT